MESTFIGREKETAVLHEAFASREAEMVAIIGRRRIGKTALIKHVYAEHIDFEATGVQNAPLTEQLQNFALRLNDTFHDGAAVFKPSNWLEAFYLLGAALDRQKKEGRMVVFLDELPWFDSHKSGFIRGLGYFWNSWAVNKDIVVVICGSAASWMIENVVNDRGGLHNRITKQIHLKPFTLSETERYFQSRYINFNPYQIVQIYLAIGGVPHYLKAIKGDKSAVQNIDALCFAEGGLLKNEFSRLYSSLFDEAEQHIAVIRALAKGRQGLTRMAILAASELPDNGKTSKVLEELAESGFITAYYPYQKVKKDMLYRLTDEYSLFYLQFIEKNGNEEDGIWQRLSQTQAYKTWSGYAFESLCLKHLPAIKQALGISGIYSVSATFYKKGTAEEQGTQIDLLIDRNDQVINIFEIKFNTEAFTLTKDYAETLNEKISIFKATTKTNKQIFLTLISAFGLKHNAHSLGLVQQVLTLTDLFKM
jgi:uncharacterized protein